jgi:hypothetical protein
MPRGPAPEPNARRRNKPTITNEDLPAEGRKGKPPAVPKAYKLKAAGRAWWNWAWKLPQATKWDKGSLYVVARRAQLEDDIVALDEADGFCVEDILCDFEADEERELGKHIEFLIRRLKGLAGGRVSVMKEMRELDNRLGLNPKALIDLRWKIAEPVKKSGRKEAKNSEVAKLDDYRDRLG